MRRVFMYLLDPIMIAVVIVAFLAVVVFFVIALKAHKAKQLRGQDKNQNRITEKKKKLESQPSAQTPAEYVAADVEPDSFAQKHWGNLSIEERYALLSPENKVLYAAAKKQLGQSRLKNFTSEICEIYFAGEKPAARLLIYRGVVYLFLNIAPYTLDRNVYNHEDVSDKDGYEMLPTMIIIKDSTQIDKIPQLLDRIG